MGFAVLHIEKGTAGKAGGLGSHIERTKRVSNADPKLSEKNFYVRIDFENNKIQPTFQRYTKTLQERINERIEKGYTGKNAIRKDAVTHLNIVLSGSHEDMKRIEGSSQNLVNWALQNAKFIGEKFGYHNIVEFGVHLDERTPHIHCVVVPLTKDGRLSAKEMMGDRRKMSKLQDDYGKVMQEKFGLQRGIKGSMATHDSVKEYYARISQRIMYPSITVDHVFNTPKIPTPPLLGRENWAERQNKAISDAFYDLASQYQAQAQKKASKAISDAYTNKLQTEERMDRLRKENAQLKGIIKEQDKKLNPEKYVIKTRDRGMHL